MLGNALGTAIDGYQRVAFRRGPFQGLFKEVQPTPDSKLHNVNLPDGGQVRGNDPPPRVFGWGKVTGSARQASERSGNEEVGVGGVALTHTRLQDALTP